jgi:hypothetical protein
MAVQVTGFFQNPQSNLIYQNPILQLVPHLEFPGKINMDVNIVSGGFGAVGYSNIDRISLTYDDQIVDAYDRLIDALETYVINDLKDANDLNKICTFVKYNPSA